MASLPRSHTVGTFRSADCVWIQAQSGNTGGAPRSREAIFRLHPLTSLPHMCQLHTWMNSCMKPVIGRTQWILQTVVPVEPLEVLTTTGSPRVEVGVDAAAGCRSMQCNVHVLLYVCRWRTYEEHITAWHEEQWIDSCPAGIPHNPFGFQQILKIMKYTNSIAA